MTELERISEIEFALSMTKTNLSHDDAIFLMTVIRRLMGGVS